MIYLKIPNFISKFNKLNKETVINKHMVATDNGVEE